MLKDDTIEIVRKPIFTCSPKALKKIDQTRITTDTENSPIATFTNYGLELLSVGTSICFEFGELSENQIRLLASRKSKKLNRSFAVIKHANCFELVRTK